jgi:hypothetical protein
VSNDRMIVTMNCKMMWKEVDICMEGLGKT